MKDYKHYKLIEQSYVNSEQAELENVKLGNNIN